MNNPTRKVIKKHIESVIKLFMFNKQELINNNHCPNYSENKLYHNMAKNELNCFFCFCPEYNNEVPEGGCKINSEKGGWFAVESLPKGKIWDCTNCDYPHHKETVEKYLNKIFGLVK